MEIKKIDGVEWRREHYLNGKLSYEHPYVNGQFHGLLRGWHTNGQMWYERPYVNGQLHGLCRGWNENGQLCYVGLWNNGRLVFDIDNPPQTSGKWKLK